MELNIRRKDERVTKKSDNTEENNTFNHSRKVSTKPTPDISESTMVLGHSNSKDSITDSSGLNVLIMGEEGNVKLKAKDNNV